MSFFGNNNNTGSNSFGFGSSNTGGGFGANQNTTSGGSLFGGNTSTSGGGGFGFGNTQNNSSPFGGGNKPAFGASATTTSGGGLFGSNANTATAGGFGGFGSNTTNTGGGFGANNNNNSSGGLFGQNKPATPAFGASNTGNSLFGGGNTSGGFGATNNTTNNPFSSNTSTTTNTSTGFGASNTGGGFTFGAGSNNATANNNNSGTSGTQFQAFSEKDAASNQNQMYQSITFQGPYATKSFEELRTEDYAQGRRFGNTNGQAGSFGQSTGFGGFGASNTSSTGGLFGNNNTATSGNTGGFGSTNTNTGAFGNTNNTTGGFGANNNTSGGLFGNKPAGGSLFGAQGSSTANTSTGGLFGSGSGSGFGNQNTQANTASSGSGLFGNNNQQQNKGFGGFGSTSNTTGGFGGSTNTGGGLFGSSTNNNNTGGGLFGQNNQQQQQNNPFGSTNNTNTSGGLFGNQNKPAGGGLFGANNNTSTGGGLFGAQNNQQQNSSFGQTGNTSGGLFGNQNQNKPAGTGLFGSSTNTGGGLFGNQNNQQAGSSLFGGNNANTGGSLFGNQNKPAGGGLFGASTNNSNTGGLFGGNQQNQQNNAGGSLFGGLGQNNQNQQSTNTNSLFGGSLNQSQPPQTTNQLHASLTGAPYGNEQLFSSIASPSPPIGPLATPLSGARPAPKKTPSLLASARLNTPVYSPRSGSIGRNNGYGFTYSTYGTPGSAFTSGSLTPGASSLLRPTGSLGSALTSRLNKSLSTSNLRSDSADGRSLLRPGAFSPAGTPGTNGSVRKLRIDRSLRTDLFAPEPKAIEAARESDAPTLRKRVSFDQAGEKDSTTPEANSSNALVRTETEEDESPSLIRAGPNKSNTATKAPEMEQVKGSLMTVPEDSETRVSAAPAPDKKVPTEKAARVETGEYWTKPAMKDLKNMSRQQLKNVGNFIVGREGVGRIEFGSVDLTNTPLEDICGTIVQLNPRSATVYQDDQDKPAMGKALNVPSTIFLENSWPRSQGGRKEVTLRSGKAYDKHIARLKRVAGTHFLKYDPDTGIWSFKVDHFTTYGLDDDEDDETELDSRMLEDTSGLSDPPETPTEQHDITLASNATGTGDLDDTFQFKLDRRSQISVPGGFDSDGVTHEYDDQTADHVMDGEYVMSGGLGEQHMDDPFRSSGGPVQAPSPGAVERYHSSIMDEDQLAEIEDALEETEQEMPGSFIAEPPMPRSILKPSAGLSAFASPEKLATESWEEQLQRTMSPKKRDRQALKEMQQSFTRARDDDYIESPLKQSILGQSALGESYLAQKSAKKAKTSAPLAQSEVGKSQAFRTAMDLMDSMYEPQQAGKKASAGAKGFEFPYPKKPRISSSDSMRPNDIEWHDAMKPHFTKDATLVYAASGSAPPVSGALSTAMRPIVNQHKDVRFAKFAQPEDLSTTTLLLQKEQTTIDISGRFPIAITPTTTSFADLIDRIDYHLAIASQEKYIWQLCSILFDDLDVSCAKFMEGIPEKQLDDLSDRIQMDALKEFWADIVAKTVQGLLKRATTAEEKALLYLTQNDIVAACDALVGAKDFKLATLVAQLPGTQESRSIMADQIKAWRDRNEWSEISNAVRALYSILAGELAVVPGKSGAAEDRVAEFNISEKFGLGWTQSFALRLYFGGFQSIEEAIKAYTDDLQSGREKVSPTNLWDNGTETEDPLMEILRLFAGDAHLIALFDPVAISGYALNSRLTWQLASILSAKELCYIPPSQLDQIAYDFATELEAAGRITDSAWIMLHLEGDHERERAVTGLLNRHGDQISTPAEGVDGTFENLTHDIQIPSPPVWKAKALYAKAGLGDPALQAEWLVRAGDFDAAHDVLCITVGPKAIIEQDYEWLSNLLQHFPTQDVEAWEQGGQVYSDFLRLVRAPLGRRGGPEVSAAANRLRGGLASMEDSVGGKKTLEERVAIIEMERVLGEWLREHGDEERDQEMGGMDEAIGLGIEGDMLRRYQRAMGMVA